MPANVRRRLGLQAGDRLIFEEDGVGGFRLLAMSKTHEVAQLAGLLSKHVPQRPVTPEQMDESVALEAVRSAMSGIGKAGRHPRKRK